MFGGQDDGTQTPQGGRPGSPAPAASDDTLHGVTDLVATDATPAPDSPAPDSDIPDSSDGGFMPTPSEPPQSSVPAPTEEAEDVAAPEPTPEPEPPHDNPIPDPAVSDDPTPSTQPSNDQLDDLLEIKQQALQQLTPLVGQLDQTPEEKFRTTMMLIQASDNESLLKEAYEAAAAISDEKLRAQALLDVINEINYFTQSKTQG